MNHGQSDIEVKWTDAWENSPCDVFYVWCASSKFSEVQAALREANLELRQMLIWDKGHPSITRTHYWYQHHACVYGVRKGKTASWVGARGQSTIWSIPSPISIASLTGEESVLEAFKAWCHEGSPFGRVDRVDVEEISDGVTYPDFQITYSHS